MTNSKPIAEKRKTRNARMKRFYDNQKDRGLVPVTGVWVPKKDYPAIKDMARKMREEFLGES